MHLKHDWGEFENWDYNSIPIILRKLGSRFNPNNTIYYDLYVILFVPWVWIRKILNVLKYKNYRTRLMLMRKPKPERKFSKGNPTRVEEQRVQQLYKSKAVGRRHQWHDYSDFLWYFVHSSISAKPCAVFKLRRSRIKRQNLQANRERAMKTLVLLYYSTWCTVIGNVRTLHSPLVFVQRLLED